MRARRSSRRSIQTTPRPTTHLQDGKAWAAAARTINGLAQMRTSEIWGRAVAGNETTTILAFYEGTGVDSAGRRIEEIWGWSNLELELSHDYIQWVDRARERPG